MKKIIPLMLMLVSLAGCSAISMTTQETLDATKKCQDAGLTAKYYHEYGETVNPVYAVQCEVK